MTRLLLSLLALWFVVSLLVDLLLALAPRTPGTSSKVPPPPSGLRTQDSEPCGEALDAAEGATGPWPESPHDLCPVDFDATEMPCSPGLDEPAINPASGLPMVGLLDLEGNPYGTVRGHELNARHSPFDDPHHDGLDASRYGCGSGWGAGFDDDPY